MTRAVGLSKVIPAPRSPLVALEKAHLWTCGHDGHAWLFTDFPNGELVEFAVDLLADLARGTCCPFALVDLLDLYRAATA